LANSNLSLGSLAGTIMKRGSISPLGLTFFEELPGTGRTLTLSRKGAFLSLRTAYMLATPSTRSFPGRWNILEEGARML
jgi:hypothetical protein